MIIDYTFFQDGLLKVEGVTALAAPSPTNEANVGVISSFIEKYEPEYLCKLLGEELYKDFLDNPEKDEWVSLNDMLVIGERISPIANYVYFHLLRNSQSSVSLNGVKADGENLVSPQRKMVSAWNDMVRMNRRLYTWLGKNVRNVQTDEELLETINEFNV